MPKEPTALPASKPRRKAHGALVAVGDPADGTAVGSVLDPDDLVLNDLVPELPEDAADLTPEEERQQFLTSARRLIVPVRRTLIQKPRGADNDRVGPLGHLVESRQHLGLDLLLLMLGLQPVIGPNDPISGAAWGRMLGVGGNPKSPATVSRTWAALEGLNLISRASQGRRPQLLREDGSGTEWTHPGRDHSPQGYFSLPRKYWEDGWSERLELPGKAMLLILLAETNNPLTPTFSLAADHIATYYGMSRSTVKRGLKELSTESLLGEHSQRVPAPRSPVGSTERIHYFLKGVFSTKYREVARDADQRQFAERRAALDPPKPTPLKEAGG